MTQNKEVVVLTIIGLVGLGAVILGIVLCFNKNKDGYNFCGTCQGVDTKVCTDRKKLSQLYQDGTWTENSEMIRPKHWTKWAWDNPSQSTGNSSMIRQPPEIIINLPIMEICYIHLVPRSSLSQELYKHPTKTKSDVIAQFCNPCWPTGAGSCSHQTYNSMCLNPICSNQQQCQSHQGVNNVVDNTSA